MVNIWNLKRGDLFKINGSPLILEYVKLDGMYSHCLTRTGELIYIGLCQVELIQGEIEMKDLYVVIGEDMENGHKFTVITDEGDEILCLEEAQKLLISYRELTTLDYKFKIAKLSFLD